MLLIYTELLMRFQKFNNNCSKFFIKQIVKMKNKNTKVEIERTSISLPKLLLEKFDGVIAKKGYGNRSEALRDLIRNLLIEEEWNENADVVAAVTLIYNHHTSNLLNELTDEEHEGIGKIISTMHIHLDAENCLEVVCLKGKASDVGRIGDKLISLEGVKYGKMVKATTGKEIA